MKPIPQKDRLEKFKRDWASDYARINRLPVEAVLRNIGVSVDAEIMGHCKAGR